MAASACCTDVASEMNTDSHRVSRGCHCQEACTAGCVGKSQAPWAPGAGVNEPGCSCVCVYACMCAWGLGTQGQTCSINCALPGLRLSGLCRTQAAHRLPLSPEDDCAGPRSQPSPAQLLPCCGHRLDKQMGETVERMLFIRRSKRKRRRLEACLHEAVLI